MDLNRTGMCTSSGAGEGGGGWVGYDNKLSVIEYDNGRGISVMRNNDTQIERSHIYLDMKVENHSFRVTQHYFTRVSVIPLLKDTL